MKLICDVVQESRVKEEDPESVKSLVNQDLVSLEFSSEFLKHFSDCLIDLKKSVENISNLLNVISTPDNLSKYENHIYYLLDLNQFRVLFKSLIEKISDLNDSVKGDNTGLVNDAALGFYSNISKYCCKYTNSSFFEMLKILIKNSFDICDKVNEEYDLDNVSINLDVLFNPVRVLNKVMYDAYHGLKKATSEEELKKAETGSNSSMNMKSIQGSEKHFLLEIFESSRSTPPQSLKNKDFSVYLENICIVNAYHEQMSNSFKSTANKSLTKLKMVRITPILNEYSKPIDTYKLIPFINYHTNEAICIFRVKFCHSSQSSLSSTIAKDARMLNNEMDLQPQQQSIPILNPIYFCIFNPNQEFIADLEHF